jgi:hypothetical protein
MATQEIELKALMRPSGRWMLTFRTKITFAVMAFIVALAEVNQLSLSETQSCWQLISNRAMLLSCARGR